MTILFLIESLGRGGAERVLVSLCSELTRSGHICHVATLFDPPDLRGELEAAGVTVHELRLPHRWDVLGAQQALRRLARAVPYEVLHTHLFFADLYGSLFLPGPRVSTFHSALFEDRRLLGMLGSLRLAVYGVLQRRRMLGHIAVSRAGGEQWAEALRLPSVRVIENGMEVPPLLDRTAVRAEVSHRYGVPEGVPLLVHIARFAPEKAHHVLIEALTRLRSAGYSFAVLMAGHGPDQASVEAAVTENHLEEVVQIVGAVPQEDVWSLMRGADVCLLPSFNEGLPLVLVEAMFFETPIVATSVGGVRDMVVEGEMGYLVPPGDAAALAQALGAMLTLSTSERRAFGQAARVRARRRYDIRHTATQHLDVFRRVVALAAARKNATVASHP